MNSRAEYTRARKAVRHAWLVKVQALPHGSISTATNWGCECFDCKRAVQEYDAARYRARVARG